MTEFKFPGEETSSSQPVSSSVPLIDLKASEEIVSGNDPVVFDTPPPDPVPDVLLRISDAISPKFADDLLRVREPVTPDRSDLARVLLHLARENARTTNNQRGIVLLS